MLFTSGTYDLELPDEPNYTPGSAENVHFYSREYVFGEPTFQSSSCHTLLLRQRR